MSSRVVKQVIVVRKDLNMNRGKTAAQVAHAAMIPFLSVLDGSILPKYRALIEEWLDTGMTKVVVGVESHEEYRSVLANVANANLLTGPIVDEGRTSFHDQPTETCFSIGPGLADEIDPFTRSLKLLR